jgi:hypothetical protein
MFAIEKPILVVEDIVHFVPLSKLTIIRHCRGERFSPTLGKDFPAPFCSGPGNKLKWWSADFLDWITASRTTTNRETPAELKKDAPEKKKRGRPRNYEKFGGR